MIIFIDNKKGYLTEVVTIVIGWDHSHEEPESVMVMVSSRERLLSLWYKRSMIYAHLRLGKCYNVSNVSGRQLIKKILMIAQQCQCSRKKRLKISCLAFKHSLKISVNFRHETYNLKSKL